MMMMMMMMMMVDDDDDGDDDGDGDDDDDDGDGDGDDDVCAVADVEARCFAVQSARASAADGSRHLRAVFQHCQPVSEHRSATTTAYTLL